MDLRRSPEGASNGRGSRWLCHAPVRFDPCLRIVQENAGDALRRKRNLRGSPLCFPGTGVSQGVPALRHDQRTTGFQRRGWACVAVRSARADSATLTSEFQVSDVTRGAQTDNGARLRISSSLWSLGERI